MSELIDGDTNADIKPVAAPPILRVEELRDDEGWVSSAGSGISGGESSDAENQVINILI